MSLRRRGGGIDLADPDAPRLIAEALERIGEQLDRLREKIAGERDIQDVP